MSGYTVEKTNVFIKWFKKLKDRQARSIISARLLKVEKGQLGDIKHLEYGVYEMRFFIGAGYRIYYCHGENEQEIIILLNGGDKSSKPAQQGDIKRAVQIRKEIMEQEDD